MKLLPIILLLFSGAIALAQPAPPMPPEPKPRGPTSITEAENAVVRRREAKTRQQQERVAVATNPAPVFIVTNQPAVQRVRDELARQKVNPVSPAPMTPHPTLGSRSPRDASKSPPMRRRKP